ncbi:MAG: GGDEF domain-containing protein [Actinomycetota bacterium]|nr:GGDEF domain-containing protein [Actinomycetota bacterium]
MRNSSGVLFLIIASFAGITFLIVVTQGATLYWYFYLIPVLLAALAYDAWGGALVALGAGLFCASYIYRSFLWELEGPSPLAGKGLTALMEIAFGTVLMLAIGAVVGLISGRQKGERRRLEKFSMVDRVTGLHNYAYFVDRLEEERKRADRFGSKLSLIMMDIDFFKSFNDRFGHAKGNLLLKKVAEVLRKNVRAIDVVARYGGEEFALLLPNTGTRAAQEVAERARRDIETTEFEGDEKEPKVKRTISAGVATYPDDTKDEVELIDGADRALYFAKEGGRNRVCVYGPEMKE